MALKAVAIRKRGWYFLVMAVDWSSLLVLLTATLPLSDILFFALLFAELFWNSRVEPCLDFLVVVGKPTVESRFVEGKANAEASSDKRAIKVRARGERNMAGLVGVDPVY